MAVLIRTATVDDAAGIAEVRVITWRKTYQGMIPGEVLDALDIAEETRRYHEWLPGFPPERACLVAEVDDPRRRVVGYCMCGPDRAPVGPSWGEIYALYVLPEYQGRGIGRALVQTAARWLAGRGCTRSFPIR